MMYPIEKLAAETLALLKPPELIKNSEWAEKYFVLPEGSSAVPGRLRLWPYQPDIINAMGDPDIERVSVVKSSRVGYTKLLMAAIGAKSDTNPCSMILLVPTDDDARGYAVDEIEPSFDQSPRLRGLIRSGRVDGRNTLTVKQIAGGGSIKILSARSPRNLRRHDAKDLYVDEEDAMEVTAEGDPVLLGEKRTLAHADRKIVRGSTPTDEETSTISKAYANSDQRVFEVPCPHCGVFFEIMWEHIVWPKGEPENAACRCPNCEEIIDERFKTQMVSEGKWRITRPDVTGHAGFRLNTLVSLFANARWGKLAAEFVQAVREGPAALQVFTNTVLGKVWKSTLEAVDEETLKSRVEDFGIEPGPDGRNRFPADVFLITAGVDTQDDRFEIGLWGWNETEAFFLGHHVIWGDPADSMTQAELDTFLKTTWTHPNGWIIRIGAVAVDSQGHKTQAVYDFCEPRLSRRIYAIISRDGARKVWDYSKKKPKGREVRIFIVGHDQAKTMVLQRIAIPPIVPDGQENSGEPSPYRIRYSSDLPDESFDQLTGERRVIRYARGNKPIVEFRRKRAGQPVEALDCACYAFVVRHSVKANFVERRARMGEAKIAEKKSLGRLSGLLNK